MNIKNNILFTKKELLYFCIQRFAFGFSYSLMIPIIPLYFNSLGISTLIIGAVMSSYGFAKALIQIPFGVVTNKIGVKKQLFISFIFMILSLATLSIVRRISIFTIAIIIYFLGATFLNSGLQNSLLKFGEDKKSEGIVFGFVGACEALGYAIGPLISSYVYNLSKVWLFPGLLIFTIGVFAIFIVLKKKAFNIKNS